MNKSELANILNAHKAWWNDDPDGERANLSGADLSGAKGLLSATAFMAENFETTADGYIAYKAFGRQYASPGTWKIEPGAIIDEVPNPDRCTECACGINVAPLKWAREYAGGGSFWKVLIRWAWLPGVVVPYNTDGKIRCERVELVEKVGTTR